MNTRQKVRTTSGQANDSDTGSDGETTAVNIGECTAAYTPSRGTNETLASLVASIASLRYSVEELRNETSRSQIEVQQLRQRIEAEASNVVPTAGTYTNFSQSPPTAPQITIPPAELQASSSSNPMWLVESSAVKLHPLPIFDGNPEDWPLFLANFSDSTAQFSYNNRQNLMPLQKALQGNAKRSVTSMLIYPDDVPKDMKELDFNFGRQDLLIRCQLQKVQQFPAINDSHLEQILQFSNRVANISAFFKSAKCEHNLMNPMLLEQLVSKLPSSKQFEWSKYAANVSRFPTVDVFSNWLSDLAKVFATMPGVSNSALRSSQQTLPQPRYNAQTNHQTGQNGGSARRVLHSNHEQLACPSCNEAHTLPECRRFQSLDLVNKWSLVKQHRLCFGCLVKGHNLLNCRRRKQCSINGCKRMHHKMLLKDIGSSSTSSSDWERILNCRKDQVTSLFKVVPVTLSGPRSKMSVCAMFDEGSSVSLLEEDVATQLGLRGRVMPLTLQWYGDSQTTESSRKVSLEIGEVNSRHTYSLKNVHTIKGLHLPKQSFEKSKFNHLKSLPIENYEDVEPVLLLGLDNCHLCLSNNVVEAGHDQPVAAETKLGWVVYGPHQQESVDMSRVLHIRKSESYKQLNNLMEEYFSNESFGVRSTTIVLESDENQRARKILLETTKNIGQRYEVGLRYAMAKQRLLSTECRMQKDAVYAENYKKEIAKYIEKGYARKLTQDEAAIENPKTWYLPHFGVVNPSKPGKLRIVFDAAAVTSSTSLNSALLKGPEQAQPLIAIIHKFRQGIVAVAGDIQEMFSQVQIIDKDQDSQRFLWRDSKSNEPISTYVMSSMIFGAICSPCCAEYTKNVNAAKFETAMPDGSHAVIANTYVDDLVISFDSAEEALNIT
ncbi:uncharacterized protein [Eurosta solidaginis]|uniref:uncharacterized protein n=1 Tax=Eurosta solidaginis TaxID=178769 RepID=UPI00353102EF